MRSAPGAAAQAVLAGAAVDAVVARAGGHDVLAGAAVDQVRARAGDHDVVLRERVDAIGRGVPVRRSRSSVPVIVPAPIAAAAGTSTRRG